MRLKRYPFCSISFLTVSPIYLSSRSFQKLKNKKDFKTAKSLHSLVIGLAVEVEIRSAEEKNVGEYLIKFKLVIFKDQQISSASIF